MRDNWSTATFITNYLPVILFPVLYGVAKIVIRVPLVKASEMDFHSDIAEIEAMTWVFVLFVCSLAKRTLRCLFFRRHDDVPPRNAAEAFWMWLVSFYSVLFRESLIRF